MMRHVLLLLLTAHLSLAAMAQGEGPLLKGSGKGLYIEHKVVAKDNFYSIGRLYNIGAKEIAAFNKLDMNKGLNIGQTVKIPLTSANFSQSVNSGKAVYYKLGEKEGLMKASAAANDVALEKLRKWNKLDNDKVSPGTKLIVGYLVSAGQQAAPVKETVVAPPVKEEKKVVTEEPVVNQSPRQDTPVKETPKNPARDLNVDVTPAKQEPQFNDRPKSDPVVAETPAGEGYFRSAFEKQLKLSPATHAETVTSGIFKTTSGWSDAKYYLLMDAVIAGTIVKITNPVNNRTIYAKVLGEMSGIRQNEGLNIRISNAAAAALQINDTEKFIIKVNY